MKNLLFVCCFLTACAPPVHRETPAHVAAAPAGVPPAVSLPVVAIPGPVALPLDPSNDLNTEIEGFFGTLKEIVDLYTAAANPPADGKPKEVVR